jgi:putative ABC transport system substrate-binding protein
MATIADELVRLRVETIMTPLNAATLAAKRATKTIPIVMITSDHPVERGLIDSYARPGGNVTGLDWWPTSSLSEKTYQILKFAVPKAKIAASIADSTDPLANLYGEEFVRRVASNVGLSVAHVQVSRAGDLARAFDRVAEMRADVLSVAGGEVISPHYREIAAFAVKRKLASISGSPIYVELGGLLRYGPDVFAAWDRAASYIDRILRGAKPADLPVERPSKYELVLNTKTAKAMGMTFPPSFMLQVDRTIE